MKIKELVKKSVKISTLVEARKAKVKTLKKKKKKSKLKKKKSGKK